MTLIPTQDITATIYQHNADEADSYDDLWSRMQEVKTQIETARVLLFTAMMETPAPFTNPAFEAVALADDRLAFALTAWE